MSETKFNLTEDKNWKRTLKVEIPPARVEPRIDKFLTEYQSEAALPGFRKGKAPKDIIRQKFLGAATQDAIAELVDESYREFLEQGKNVNPITRPAIHEMNYDPAAGLSFTASFEVRPEIELKKYKGLSLSRRIRPVKDEEVEQVMEHLREGAGEWSAVQRQAKAGDLLILDLEVVADSQNKIKEKHIPNYEVVLTPNLLPEFKKALLGLEPAAQTEITITYPADYDEKNLAGSMVTFKASVKEIKEKILPPKDDSLAQRLKDWNVQTYLELVLAVRKKLENGAREESDEALRQQARNRLVEQNPFEFPASFIAAARERLKEDVKKEKKEMADAEFDQQVWPPFERMMKWDFLVHALAEKEKIEVTEPDAAAWMARFAANYGMQPEEASEFIKKSGRIKNVRESIREEKVIDFLLANAVIQNEDGK
ncbi:MAG: trigger factor [candidate division Zixibacteria bacterium]|nr:trigger factor [candidate division Zixibacteria bacterium]MCI0597314.1 trigger factor [candidate division Zixibacteria bacterium]